VNASEPDSPFSSKGRPAAASRCPRTHKRRKPTARSALDSSLSAPPACRRVREPRQRSGSRARRAIGHGRPTRGRRLPSGGEEQTERGEQDEGGNRPAKDLETHRATSFSGLTVLWSVLSRRRRDEPGRVSRSAIGTLALGARPTRTSAAATWAGAADRVAAGRSGLGP